MRCRVCGNKTDAFDDTKFDNSYGYCHNCEFIGIETEQHMTFSEERSEYDRHENSIENEGYVAMFKNFLDAAVIPFVTEGEGLDFGSGPEPVLAQVMERDYEFKMDYYDLHYQPKRLYEEKTYDLIVSTEVMEHLHEPLDIMQILADHLKPGGILAMMTLFHENDNEKFLDWWYRRDVTHIGFFTPKTFEVLAEIVGLKVIYTDDYRYVTLQK